MTYKELLEACQACGASDDDEIVVEKLTYEERRNRERLNKPPRFSNSVRDAYKRTSKIVLEY